jgi:hypothetical protein
VVAPQVLINQMTEANVKRLIALIFLTVLFCVQSVVGQEPSGFQAWGKKGYESAPVPPGWTEIKYDQSKGFEYRFRSASIGWWYILEAVENDIYPFTEADKQRGYVLFINHYLDQVYPTVLPKRDQVGRAWRIFATPGEYEPATFSVHSVKNLGKVRVSAGDLVAVNGKRIRRENIDVRTVRALRKSVDDQKKLFINYPHLLEQLPEINVDEGQTREFWLTVYVPQDAAPGKYTAQVHFAPENGPASDLPLELEVLPFKLQKPPLFYLMNFSGFNKENEEKNNYYHSYTHARKHLVDMREHGMTNVLISPQIFVTDGRIDIKRTLERLNEVFAATLESGFGKLMLLTDTFAPLKTDGREGPGGEFRPFTEELDNEYVNLIKAIDDLGRNKFGLQLYFEHCNEPASHPTMDAAIHYNQLLKQRLPNVKTHTNLGPPVVSRGKFQGQLAYDILGKYLDIQTYNGAPPELVDRVKKDGKYFTVKNGGGYGGQAEIARVWCGFYIHKVKVDGMKQWQYISARLFDNPYDNYDVHEPQTMYVFPAPDGPIPTRAWEAMREGIDDSKYIYTLRQAIKGARASGSVQAKKDAEEAERFLEGLLHDVAGYDFRSDDPAFALAQKKAFYQKAFLDVWRWEIAQRILSLQAYLKD